MNYTRLFLLAVWLPSMAWGQVATVKEIDKNFSPVSAEDSWIYNDLNKGMVLAKAANKPLMIVLRCIP